MISRWRADGGDQNDDIAGVARRLKELCRGLSGNAALVYQSLQRALERCRTADVGVQPDFGECFHRGLLETFQDLHQVEVRRVGGARSSQWEVTVDGGAPVFCSVRLSVLGDDAGLLGELRSKARVVKDVLKEGGEPDAGGLEGFRRACAERAAACGCAGPGQPPGRAPGAGLGEREDVLSAVLGARLVASFECERCRHAWTTYNGRRQQDGTIRRQYCGQCGGSGYVRASRPYEAADGITSGGRQQGMHQSNLCEACREFGNCMGIFDDPFVVSTALSLIFNKQVQWGSYSETPELLVARLGPLEGEQPDLQVCLQPHVFESSPVSDQSGSRLLTWQPVARPRREALVRQGDPRAARAEEPAPQLTVKNQEAFQDFLNCEGSRRSARRGAGSAGGELLAEAMPPPPPPQAAEPPHAACASAGAASAACGAAGAPTASSPEEGDGPPAPAPGGQPDMAGGSGAAARKAGRNKIIMPAAAAATPRLDRLSGGMRRHQLIVAANAGRPAGEAGAETVALAERYLERHSGAFMEALCRLHGLGRT